MVKSHSFIAVPPGATIKEQITDRNMSQKEFALRMDMSEKHISNLINGEVILTTDVAMRLEMVLGIPAHFWSNLENLYREKLIKIENENSMDEDIKILKKFPYNEMQKNKWVDEGLNINDKVVSLRKFFEVVKLTKVTEPIIAKIACKRQAAGEKADYALIAWAQKARLEARKIETKKIDIKRLVEFLPEIRKMTNMQPKEFCPLLCEKFKNCGIALIFLPHIGGSFLHGATFKDKNKIVVGLTVRGKDADKFWFSLFHEVGHIVLGHVDNLNGTTIDEERDADEFARDRLIPLNDFNRFIEQNKFTEQSINRFSMLVGVDRGIIVGRLQKEGYILYSRFNKLKTKYTLRA